MFSRDALNKVPGWLATEAAETTMHLMAFQEETFSSTRIAERCGILELGVFKGKYLSLLAALSKATPVVGVDAFLERYGVPLADEWVGPVKSEILQAIASLGTDTSRVTLVRGLTSTVSSADLTRLSPNLYRFISVDAGHDAEDLMVDMPLAESVLAPGGIIAVDDAFNSITPGVVEGVCRWMDSGGHERLAAFASGYNKFYFCKLADHKAYFAFCRRMIESAPAGFLEASRVRQRANDSILFQPRFFGWPVAVF
jgi:hypothetical protein